MAFWVKMTPEYYEGGEGWKGRTLGWEYINHLDKNHYHGPHSLPPLRLMLTRGGSEKKLARKLERENEVEPASSRWRSSPSSSSSLSSPSSSSPTPRHYSRDLRKCKKGGLQRWRKPEGVDYWCFETPLFPAVAATSMMEAAHRFSLQQITGL